MPRSTERSQRLTAQLRKVLALTPAGLLLIAGSASAQLSTNTTTTAPTTTTAQVIEWDTPTNADMQPGAITADLYSNAGGKVWFTTRQGPVRVYLFQPSQNFKYGMAQITSWPLDPGASGPTGGLKRIRGFQQFIYVRTGLAIQKIDTINDRSTTYCDDALPGVDQSIVCQDYSPVSDVAVDNHNFVYYTFNGFLQRLDASPTCAVQPCAPVAVTRWNLTNPGGIYPAFTSFAGICNGGPTTDPCISGVAVHPKYQNLVYVAEPGNNTIAEVNTTAQPCSCPTPQNVRRWDLTKVGAVQPRQINFDQDGILWIITGGDSTGTVVHLVSLNPKNNTMTAYQIPPGTIQDTFGVAPDSGMVGYTSNDSDGGPSGDPLPEHKVGMLIPKGQGMTVGPQPYWADYTGTTITPSCMPAPRDASGATTAVRRVQARIVPEASGNGTFVEAFINRNADTSTQTSYVPLGIAPAFNKAVGTFLYAVGQPDNPAVNRIGFLRFPRKGLKARHEREDKDCDDDGTGHDDEDHDGVPDRYKTTDSKGRMDRQNDSLGPGQSTDYTFTSGPNTMAIIAAIQADNALAPVSVRVVDPNGVTLAVPVATPGVAVATVVPTVPGTYTIRVKNEGALPINHETQMIAREPLSLP